MADKSMAPPQDSYRKDHTNVSHNEVRVEWEVLAAGMGEEYSRPVAGSLSYDTLAHIGSVIKQAENEMGLFDCGADNTTLSLTKIDWLSSVHRTLILVEQAHISSSPSKILLESLHLIKQILNTLSQGDKLLELLKQEKSDNHAKRYTYGYGYWVRAVSSVVQVQCAVATTEIMVYLLQLHAQTEAGDTPAVRDAEASALERAARLQRLLLDSEVVALALGGSSASNVTADNTDNDGVPIGEWVSDWVGGPELQVLAVGTEMKTQSSDGMAEAAQVHTAMPVQMEIGVLGGATSPNSNRGGVSIGCVDSHTDWDDDGHGHSTYLDRHTIKCPMPLGSHYLSHFHIQSDTDRSRVRMAYTCCPLPLGLKGECTIKKTSREEDGGGHATYLDRHHITSPGQASQH
jgi:hypothetical protein